MTTMTLRSGARGRGFTLVEVVVAAAILALGMGAILSAASALVAEAEGLRRRVIAAWVASDVVADYLTRPDLKPGSSVGEVEMAKTRWRWRAVARPAENAAEYIEIEVEVEDDERSFAVLRAYAPPPREKNPPQ